MSSSALRLEKLRFRYEDGPWIIDADRFELGPGEHALLTGGSGRGKSTLLHLIAGLIDPVEGRVEVAGEWMHGRRGAARDHLRGRHIGMVFQTFHLLHGFTAAENVMAALLFSDLPRRDHRARADELLSRLGIDRPDAPADRMSIGQQQRVAVARAIACRPELVLADEPTASLDPDNADAAMELLQEVCRESGAALLCVSHDPTMSARFERRHDLAELSGAAVGGGVG